MNIHLAAFRSVRNGRWSNKSGTECGIHVEPVGALKKEPSYV